MTRTEPFRPLGIALLLLAGFPALWTGSDLRAQSWSETQFERRDGGESVLRVEVTYGAGIFRLAAADPGRLYRARFRFDEEAFTPIHTWDGETLRIGTEGRSGRRSPVRRSGDQAELELRLGTRISTDLEISMGAVRAEVDLGGIPLRSLDLTTGASETTLRVSRPNPRVLETATLKVGAASFQARELGRLRARNLEVTAGVGEVRLDMSGLEPGESTLRVTVGIGAFELVVPDDVGIHLTRQSSFLASLNAPGLNRQGSTNVWTTPGWEGARTRLIVEVENALGSVTVTRAR